MTARGRLRAQRRATAPRPLRDRPRLSAQVRRVADACRNVRVGPEEARRQLVAQLEREALETGLARPVGQDRDDRPRSAVGTTGSEPAGDGPAPTDVAAALAAVTSALDATGVPYLVVPPDDGRPFRVVVPQRARRRSLRALGGLDEAELSRGGGRWAPLPGCELEFRPLDRTLPDRLWRLRWTRPAVPFRNPTAVEETRIGDRWYPTAAGLGDSPRVDTVSFPIDVVYTWVDGTDPRWLAEKEAVLRRIEPTAGSVDADDPSRFHSHDELRYSLRSVATFADFVRHVFIVTDGQVPPWLNTDHERITVVDHTEIFPDDTCLPTFNSHAIESRLHHIEGLAEHYLYLNDDFFFGRRVTPEQFFHANGTTKFFPSPAQLPTADLPGTERAVDAAAQNTRRLVQQRFGRVVSHKLKHAPYPQRRSVLFEMEEVLRDEFSRTAASRVRGADDVPVPSSLYHHYAFLTGRAVPGRIGSRYVSLDDAGLSRRLRGLRRRRNFDVLCINDAVDAHAGDLGRRSRRLARFMAAYWPTRSPFER